MLSIVLLLSLKASACGSTTLNNGWTLDDPHGFTDPRHVESVFDVVIVGMTSEWGGDTNYADLFSDRPGTIEIVDHAIDCGAVRVAGGCYDTEQNLIRVVWWDHAHDCISGTSLLHELAHVVEFAMGMAKIDQPHAWPFLWTPKTGFVSRYSTYDVCSWYKEEMGNK